MKLGFLARAYSNQIKTVESKYYALFWRKSYTLGLPRLKFLLARALAFIRLIIRLLLNGYRPQIRQGRDRDNNVYWYAYYPLSGVSKVLAFDAEIKQWLELTQEI
ncbi:MAG: hypothetical protein QNJ34_21535 [Xenococcaceae cyanobacterium MO_188.B29]|nr:hypothetical protein [Xenococcaceae cyanobacterium MO_188.B29]